MLKGEALQILILMLLQKERKQDADEFIRMFGDLIGSHRKKSSSPVWEYSLRHTRFGTVHRIDTLGHMAEKILFTSNYTVSADFAAQAIEILQDSRYEPEARDLRLLGIHRDALYGTGNLDECISSCQQLLEFSIKLASGPMVTNSRWQTEILLARCLAEQGNMTEANTWLSKANDEIGLLGPDEHHQGSPSWIMFTLDELALIGRYRLCQSMVRELLETNGIQHSNVDEDLGFGPLESLVSNLNTVGCLDTSYPDFLHCHSLLMVAHGARDMVGKADWFRQRLWSIYDDFESFSKRIPVLKLMYIDTCLQQDDGLSDALEGYKSLGRFFFEHGDIEASDLVSSDAESRIFSHLSSDDPWAFKLASDICLYTGRFSKSIAQLCQAYQLSPQGYGDAGYGFEMEMFYACTYIERLEEFEEDLDKADLRLAFLEKACEHLSKASRARDETDRSKGSESQEEQRDGEQDVEESRKERMTDLKARLEDLNRGSMLTGAMARLGSVAQGAEVSSEGNSW
jgi:tetratricopeptide (TPR) repeat protein